MSCRCTKDCLPSRTNGAASTSPRMRSGASAAAYTPAAATRVSYPVTSASGSVVDDDLPDDVAVTERTQGVVEVIEFQALGDHAFEVQAAGPPQAEHPCVVAPHVGRAVERAEHLLAVKEQLERSELDLLVGAPGADDHDGSAPARRRPRGPDRLRGTHHLEGVVEAFPAGELSREPAQIIRVDGMGGTETAGRLVLGRHGVDPDDDSRAGEAGPLDRRNAHAPAADDHDGRAGLDARGVD